MPKWHRVKDKSTGHEYSVARVNPDAHDLLEKPGEDSFGRPLPAKPNVHKGGALKPKPDTDSGQHA